MGLKMDGAHGGRYRCTAKKEDENDAWMEAWSSIWMAYMVDDTDASKKEDAKYALKNGNLQVDPNEGDR